jgi:hypothetical protein
VTAVPPSSGPPEGLILKTCFVFGVLCIVCFFSCFVFSVLCSGFRFQVSEFRVQVSGFRLPGFGFEVQCLGAASSNPPEG